MNLHIYNLRSILEVLGVLPEVLEVPGELWHLRDVGAGRGGPLQLRLQLAERRVDVVVGPCGGVARAFCFCTAAGQSL